MPTYQYACPDCDYEFETVQKFTDKPLKRCPRCGKRRVHRVITNVAVSFKGSGWYITDSKKADEAKRGKAKGEDTSTDGKEKEAATATETSKPETAQKAETKIAETAASSDGGKSDARSTKKEKKS
jgi:putative FmdB family regulatory protein